MKRVRLTSLTMLWLLVGVASFGAPRELQVGVAGHAFDHLGDIGDQAEVAAASGATLIYTSGLGGLGYAGLPDEEGLARARQATAAYVRQARRHGIRLAIGYVCATSIVGLDGFDRNWSKAFRARFSTPPSAWRQQDRQGHPLPSWYGGRYQPACMNNPDWRAYEHFMVRQQLEAGCDGIFFDNPTVHPQGCYCPHCLEQFARFLREQQVHPAAGQSLAELRDWAVQHPAEFMTFRCTIARNFLADMRRYARTIKSGALITANNSLNSADVLYAQCRRYGYNIAQMSQAEDFVVVEDMSSQPRLLASGQTLEYGPTYEQLRAISHGKPVVAVTLADGDYHTPPNLMRLALAEAAAHDSSYLAWPTWPEPQRTRMSAAVRPEAEFLRQQARLLNDTQLRRDVVLFLPFRDWVKTAECKASKLAVALSRDNVQYGVVSEDDFRLKSLRGAQVLLTPSLSEFTTGESKVVEGFQAAGGRVVSADTPGWQNELRRSLTRPSVVLPGPAVVRAVVHDQHHRTLVHLLNLGVQRLSAFEDKVDPVRDLHLTVRVPLRRVRSVRLLTADPEASSGAVEFTASRQGEDTLVEVQVPRVQVASLLVVE